jgi:hypothetical protein
MRISSPISWRLAATSSVGLAAVFACNAGTASAPADSVTAAETPDVVGIPDLGLDPSVVALTNARGEACSGVLVGSDVVLTARRCVTLEGIPADCTAPAEAPLIADPATLHVYAGPSVGASWAAAGAAVVAPAASELCGADVAVVILDASIDGLQPVLVSESGAAQGGHVRTVGLGWASASASAETDLLREHRPVLDVSPTELAVGQATCVAAPGAIAFDEVTGEIVGVLSRWGTSCGAPGQFDVFTRTDTFYELIKTAIGWEPALASEGLDAGGSRARDAGHKRDAGRARKPSTDIGAACLAATDCGAGLCVSADQGQYCSQACAPDDPCPTHFKCVIASGGQAVCARS